MATQATQTAAPPPAPPQPEGAPQTRAEKAEAIVRRNVYWGVGAGAIPVPFLDFVGITAVQIKMLKQLSAEYEIPFVQHKVKNIVGSLLSAGLSVGSGTALTFSILKIVPIVGQAAGFVSVSIAAGAITYATGRVFIQHFESGGTFLDFDPEKVREHFRKEVERGKEVASKVQSQAKS